MSKKIFLTTLIFFLVPLSLGAQEKSTAEADQIFKAQVREILEERKTGQEEKIQQKIELEILEGKKKGERVIYNGIGEIVVADSQIYKKGDKVLVAAVFDHQGKVSYYITDYVRSSALWWLFGLFVLALIVVGRLKGLKALFSLALTFFIIIKFIIPGILGGANALLITITGSFLILLAVIYITEGFRELSHLSVVSIFASLLLVFFISWFFVQLAHLSGLSGENILPLISLGEKSINFQGLLLAGILI